MSESHKKSIVPYMQNGEKVILLLKKRKFFANAFLYPGNVATYHSVKHGSIYISVLTLNKYLVILESKVSQFSVNAISFTANILHLSCIIKKNLRI